MNNQPILYQPSSRYHAYMVRLWQDGPYATWRASAQCVQSGKVLRFADVEQLFVFLATQTAITHPVMYTSGEYRTDQDG